MHWVVGSSDHFCSCMQLCVVKSTRLPMQNPALCLAQQHMDASEFVVFKSTCIGVWIHQVAASSYYARTSASYCVISVSIPMRYDVVSSVGRGADSKHFSWCSTLFTCFFIHLLLKCPFVAFNLVAEATAAERSGVARPGPGNTGG